MYSKKAGGEKLPFHTANKHLLGEWLIRQLVVKPALKRAFSGIHIYVDPATLRLRQDPSLPLIICSTHVGWWDGYMAYVLERAVFRRDSYLMMEEVSLQNFPFFAWLGVFGIDRHDMRKALASLEYIIGVLMGRHNTVLWMFPQGTIAHPDARPLKVYSGAAHIARRLGRCALVPVAVRYEFLMEQAPIAFARLGPPMILNAYLERISSKELIIQLTAAMTSADDALHADLVANNLQPYRRIMAGRSSISRTWGGVMQKLGSLRRQAGGE